MPNPKPFPLKQTDYNYNAIFRWYLHKDYSINDGYLFKDDDDNYKPIIITKRWAEVGDDYWGFADENGDECEAIFN